MTKENKLLKKRSFTYLLAVIAGAALLCGVVQSARASAPPVDFTLQTTSTQATAIEVGKSFKVGLKSIVKPKDTHEEHLATKNQAWYITRVIYSKDDKNWTNEWSGHNAKASKANFFKISISGSAGGGPVGTGDSLTTTGKLSGTLGIGDHEGDQAGYYIITFESTADASATVNGKEESGNITSSPEYAEVIAIKIGLKSVDMSTSTSKWGLDPGVLCLNAQPKYKQAQWQATVLPKGTKATVSLVSKSDSGITGDYASDLSVPSTTLSDGDNTFKVTGGKDDGQYILKITSNAISSVSKKSATETAFKFVAVINGPIKPGVTPIPNPGPAPGKSSGFWGNAVQTSTIPAAAFGEYADYHHDDSYMQYGIGDKDLDFVGAIIAMDVVLVDHPQAPNQIHSAMDSVSKIGIATDPATSYLKNVKASFDVSYKGIVSGSGYAWSGGTLTVGINYGILGAAGSINVQTRSTGYGVLGVRVGPNKQDFDKTHFDYGSLTDTLQTPKPVHIKASVGSQFVNVSLLPGTASVVLRYDAGVQAKTTAASGTEAVCQLMTDNVSIDHSYWKIP